MAQRRMFSLKIVDTDDFLNMPISARLLYYDLAMRADDDGFVSSPQKIIKITGAAPDDYRVLCSKQYIFPFEAGVCVIKDWKVHNYIQKDRYEQTRYQEEFKQLKTDDYGSYTKCIQDVSKMYPQVRLELGKDREYIPHPAAARKSKKEVDPSFEEIWLRYPKRYGTNSKEAACRAYKARREEKESQEVLAKGVDNYRAYCEAESFIGTKWVMKGSTFFGRDKNYLQYQEKQKERTLQDAIIERLCT